MLSKYENLATPEQRIALRIMEEHMPPIEIFKEVAASIPKTVPDGTYNKLWNHGSCRIAGMIGGYDSYAFEVGTVPQDVDLSHIKYIAFYRQAVANKYTGEVKVFITTIPLGFYGEVVPGQAIKLAGETIGAEWDKDTVMSMAMTAFVKLQDMVIKFHNQEEMS